MWLDNFKAKGGKFDMIAFSHYPFLESKMWVNNVEKTLSPSEVNEYAIAYIKKAILDYGVPVIIAEVGVKQASADATSVLSTFMTEVRKIEKCAGVFYWEPQVNGSWKPEIYSKPAELSKYTGESITSPWGPYDQGAFTADYRPSPILDCFAK
jgi:arabinogalactan endo-1,4-beta-galactosidase